MTIPIIRGDKVAWTSRGKDYTSTVEVRVDSRTWLRVLTGDGRRLIALRQQLTRIERVTA